MECHNASQAILIIWQFWSSSSPKAAVDKTLIMISQGTEQYSYDLECVVIWYQKRSHSYPYWRHTLNGSVQDCSNWIAYTLELLQSCAEPLICFTSFYLSHNVKLSWLLWQDTSIERKLSFLLISEILTSYWSQEKVSIECYQHWLTDFW